MSDRRVIHCTCATHGGTPGFANLVISKHSAEIQLNPHVDGSCLLTLNEDEATSLRDTLTEWLG